MDLFSTDQVRRIAESVVWSTTVANRLPQQSAFSAFPSGELLMYPQEFEWIGFDFSQTDTPQWPVSQSELASTYVDMIQSSTLPAANRDPLPPPQRKIELRTSKRKPRSTRSQGEQLTSAKLRAREGHNIAERQYRNRVNVGFEKLLAILHHCNESYKDIFEDVFKELDGEKITKAQVLDLSRNCLLVLIRIAGLECDVLLD